MVNSLELLRYHYRLTFQIKLKIYKSSGIKGLFFLSFKGNKVILPYIKNIK